MFFMIITVITCSLVFHKKKKALRAKGDTFHRSLGQYTGKIFLCLE